MLRVLKVLDSHVDHVLEGLVEVVADPEEPIKKKLMGTILIDIFLALILKVINLTWHFPHFLILYFLGLLRKIRDIKTTYVPYMSKCH